MKIIALQGSPKQKGNTAKVFQWVEEELISLGHEVESIYLNSKKIHGCLACGKCKEREKSKLDITNKDNRTAKANNSDIIDRIGCVQNDDAVKILELMVNADLVIFTSPIYFWGFTAQLKSLIDRTYSLYTNYHKPDHASLVEGQRQALLMTGGGDYENNAQLISIAFNNLQKPLKSINVGELFIGNCSTPDMLDITTKEKAIKFAQSIVE